MGAEPVPVSNWIFFSRFSPPTCIHISLKSNRERERREVRFGKTGVRRNLIVGGRLKAPLQDQAEIQMESFVSNT